MEAVEEQSEAVANRLIEFSDAVRKRDYPRAREYLSADFLGTGIAELEVKDRETLALGTSKTHYHVDTTRETAVDRDGFVASLEKLLAPLEAIEYVFFKTRGAEFESDGSRGILRMTASIIGRGEQDRPYSLYGWARAEVIRIETNWYLRRFVVNRLQVMTRDEPIFTDVAAAAGVAEFGPRLGKKGNASFYWRGAATADIDGDGLFDIFTSTSRRNFLYRNRGDGTFEDVAEKAGLVGAPGVTGPLFFDYDRDGDQDLFCGYVGWEVDGVPDGERIHLYQNDGEGRFDDVTEAVGLGGVSINAFSAGAADVDNDGWLDLYICNYNRLDAIYPNSWYRATNGSPNALFHNRQGKAFENVAVKAGVAGTGWSYAAAFADFDEDGDQDLYVANDYGDNCLYRNRGDLTFEDVAAELGVLDTGNGMGATWGDLDNDGRLDLYVSNMSSSAGNRILKRLAADGSNEGSSSRGRGSPTHEILVKLAAGNTIFRQSDDGFERVPVANGGIMASWAWSASILDINLDGTQDVYVANGFISGDSLKDT